MSNPTGPVAPPSEHADRKAHPITTGVLDYFPDALLAVSNVSKRGNDQHNPGEPLHWAKEKSRDEADCIVRHLLQRGTIDTDGVRHSAKVAWRALALLQREIEVENGYYYDEATNAWVKRPDIWYALREACLTAPTLPAFVPEYIPPGRTSGAPANGRPDGGSTPFDWSLREEPRGLKERVDRATEPPSTFDRPNPLGRDAYRDRG